MRNRAKLSRNLRLDLRKFAGNFPFRVMNRGKEGDLETILVFFHELMFQHSSLTSKYQNLTENHAKLRAKLKETQLELQQIQRLSLNTVLLSPPIQQVLAKSSSFRELHCKVARMQRKVGEKGELRAQEAAILHISLFMEKTQSRTEAVLRYLQPILLSEPLEEYMKMRLIEDFTGLPEALPDCTNSRLKAFYAEVLPVRFGLSIAQLRQEEKSGSVDTLKSLLVQTYEKLMGKFSQSMQDLTAVFGYLQRNIKQTSGFLQGVCLRAGQIQALQELASGLQPSASHLSQLFTGLLESYSPPTHRQSPSGFRLKADFTSYLSQLNSVPKLRECRASSEAFESTGEDTEIDREPGLSQLLQTTSPQQTLRKRREKAASWSLPVCYSERDLAVRATATEAKIRAIRQQSEG